MNSAGTWRSWLIPPAVSTWAHKRLGHSIEFDDSHSTWALAEQNSSGYSNRDIIQQVSDSTAAVLRGDAVFERDGVMFTQSEYRWPVVAGLLSVAAREGSLRVLDFGGSLGSLFWQHRSLLDGVNTTWGVVEQAGFVKAGKELDQDQVTFFDSIQSANAELSPNVVLLSSVLQYLPDPGSVLEELLQTQANTLILDRTPMSNELENTVCIQKVPRHIYSASYPAWVFSRRWLFNNLSQWEIVAQFPGIEPETTTSAGISFAWDGFIARRKSHD